MSNDESAIIHRILDGDQESYRLLIDRYKHQLYRHCFKIVHYEDAAEDVAQEAFIQAYRELARYDHRYRFSTWLFTIATRKALDHLRSQRTLSLDDTQLELLVSNYPSPHSETERQDIHQAVADLPEPYRTVISRHYWEGRPYQEIADLLHVPLGTVKGWMYRAKLMLRKALQ